MKLLLILLSILLLSSPVAGQETGVLYLWDTSSGQVWKTFRDKDTQPKYKGQVENETIFIVIQKKFPICIEHQFPDKTEKKKEGLRG